MEITVNLDENWLGVLDTGVGMTGDQVASGFAPSVSFKDDDTILKKREKNPYRGYKGVGLTFLAYGTDDIALHSKRDGVLTKGRMQYGRAWAEGTRREAALIVQDDRPSPMDRITRGTYVRIEFSDRTRPKNLARVAGNLEAWRTIVRTRTAAGQILLGCEALVPIDLRLTVVSGGNEKTEKLQPRFLYPHGVERTPPFRFLDLVDYYKNHGEQTAPPPDKLRQDGLWLTSDADKISEKLTDDQRKQFEPELEGYSPALYAFVPYQGSVWGELNLQSVGRKDRSFLYPGLVLAVNGQRLADIFEIDATRFETFSRNVLVVMQFNNAKPDYGRKTLQDEVIKLAKRTADAVVQYLAKQRELLRAPGESPTPEQRRTDGSLASGARYRDFPPGRGTI